MSAPDNFEGLIEPIDAIQQAYRSALRAYHNWNDWEQEEYDRIEAALREADRQFRDTQPDLSTWQQIAKQERARADALAEQVAALNEQYRKDEAKPFMVVGELDADGVTQRRYQDGPRPG